MSVEIFDSRACSLGEGPLWHPERKQLFWFDINNKQLLSQKDGAKFTWQFPEHVSAAGWVSASKLLIASETALFTFDVDTEDKQHICALEADISLTRSNDGRADPWGGFWIGTMGKNAEPKLGSIYRFYEGDLHKLYPNITISNSICFSPDQQWAYYTDTLKRQIMRQKLDADGWPDGAPDIFVDLRAESLNPDGSVVDADGYLWNAQWGASRLARYAPDGSFVEAVNLPASQATCPAFGGPQLSTLFATSASDGLDSSSELDGATFYTDMQVAGQKEHQVKL